MYNANFFLLPALVEIRLRLTLVAELIGASAHTVVQNARKMLGRRDAFMNSKGMLLSLTRFESRNSNASIMKSAMCIFMEIFENVRRTGDKIYPQKANRLRMIYFCVAYKLYLKIWSRYNNTEKSGGYHFPNASQIFQGLRFIENGAIKVTHCDKCDHYDIEIKFDPNVCLCNGSILGKRKTLLKKRASMIREARAITEEEIRTMIKATLDLCTETILGIR